MVIIQSIASQSGIIFNPYVAFKIHKKYKHVNKTALYFKKFLEDKQLVCHFLQFKCPYRNYGISHTLNVM